MPEQGLLNDISQIHQLYKTNKQIEAKREITYKEYIYLLYIDRNGLNNEDPIQWDIATVFIEWESVPFPNHPT